MDEKKATITVDRYGDEEDRTYFFCEACGVYSVWVCIEAFFTDSLSFHAGRPIPQKKGDEIVRLIGECPAQWMKSCKCPAHRKLEREG
jgi:hypothetical protein